MENNNEFIEIEGTLINITELKSKKGRKSKQDLLLLEKIKEKQKELGIYKEEEPKVPKKRGRKPKGGKIINAADIHKPNLTYKTNIILHLKCNSKDLVEQNNFIGDMNYNPNVETIEAFNNNDEGLTFINDNQNNNDLTNINIPEKINNQYEINYNQELHNNDCCNKDDSNNKQKDIWEKLKKLQYNLKYNKITDKKSNCFWCSYEFNNLPIYIPKYYINGNYEVYGCFCTPECACAYLCNEKIDTSTKWERYSLLNSIYSNIYNYEKNIKPAPNPHYLLDKFYGNMSIDEYRKLLNNDNLLLVVDKPLTKVLPEIHYENDEIPNMSNKNNNGFGQKKYRLSRNKPALSQNNTTWAT